MNSVGAKLMRKAFNDRGLDISQAEMVVLVRGVIVTTYQLDDLLYQLKVSDYPEEVVSLNIMVSGTMYGGHHARGVQSVLIPLICMWTPRPSR
jgi:hypothetical protein